MIGQADSADPLEPLPAAGDANGSDWYGAEVATFGDRLAGAREACGMTRAQLARRIGVKETALAKWEDDLAEPRANRLQMLSGVLGVSLGWLLTAEGQGPEGPVADHTVEDDVRAILTELRQVRSDLTRQVERVGRLEKRLRILLEGPH